MKVPEKYFDEIFNFAGQWDMPSCCGLKIIRKQEINYIIVTELYQENPGTSVTYAAESLYKQICEAKHLTNEHNIYIECNPDTNSKLSFYDEEYFEVTFEEGQDPKYRQLEKTEIKYILE